MTQLQQTPATVADGAAALDDEVYVFPASFSQQRLWFFDQLEPGSPFYSIPTAVRLRGRLDVAALHASLGEIVRRHETLRTSFASVDGQLAQLVASTAAVPLPLIDLRATAAEVREAEARRLIDAEARRPFDLARGPLLRATLLQLADDEHIALLVLHHIVADGWSVGVLIEELGTLYDAFARGRPSPLPELAIQYGDFAEWQREWLASGPLDRQLAYWRQQLAGPPPTLELPTDRPRPPVQSSSGAARSATIPAELLARLKELGRREGATLFMTLLAAFETLLYRYSGQEDFCVGTPIAGRTRPELEPLIGCFINTLVLRADLAGGPTFRELLRRTRDTALAAYAHQDLPFETLVETLQPARSLSHSPLFQVMFILQNAKGSSRCLSSLALEQLDADTGTSTFDLTLQAVETPGGLLVDVEYCDELFDAATINRLLGHFANLLAAAVADPDVPVARLTLLSAAERLLITQRWAGAPASTPPRCVHELFQEQVARTPGSLALVAGEDRRSYAALNARANQIAHALRHHGVGPETLVALALPRSADLVAALLAVLKAGGAYLPLDPSAPPERLRRLLADARPGLALTSPDLADTISPLVDDAPTLCLSDDIALQPADDLPAHTTADQLAYVIYTSGSTGAPKGVEVTHGNLAAITDAWLDAYDLRAAPRRHLQMASATFDVFTGDVARALCSGGTLILCPRETLLDPRALLELIRREQVDTAEFVPAVLRLLLDHVEATGARLDPLRLLICGSDSWSMGDYRRARRLCPPATTVVNSFGVTEATIDSTYWPGPDADLRDDQPVPIGRPFAGTLVRILDAHGQVVPVGVPGELVLGGPGVARGYLRQPERTAERFVADRPGAGRLYRTGDRARWRPDGTIELLGRLDAQVKIRGFRVEPGEIEAVLARHPALQAAAVAVHPDAPGGPRLAAYLVPARAGAPPAGSAGGARLAAGMREYLTAQLPEHMVPAAFVVVDALPLTPSGKVDRKALPAPDWSQRARDDTFVAPRTPAEEILARIWGEVLGVERVGALDEFFALGGHSLLATQLVSRIRAALHAELPLRAVFEAPTLAEMAARIETIQRSGARAEAPPIRPAPRQGELPLSFAQQRLWFLDQLEPGSASYNMPESVRLRGPLDVSALRRTLQEIVRRHEVLRTGIVTVDGRAVLRIEPSLSLDIPLVDLRDLPPDEREAVALRRVDEDARQPFDLARPPLLRATLYRLADDDHIAAFTIHHIVSDDWSSQVLSAELAAIYTAFAAGRPSPLPELPLQYADYAAWQRAWLEGERREAQLSYWRRQLAGAPPALELPTDRPRPAVQTFRGAVHHFSLGPHLSRQLDDFNRRAGATLFMTLLAAFDALLMRYSGQEDLCVGTPIAGRTRAELEGLIGMFVNTLVLRADLSGEPGFGELLRRVRATALDAYAHQDVPFEMVVDALQPERNLSHPPLFQVMFVLQNLPRPSEASLPASGATLRLTDMEAHSGTAKFDLTLFVVEQDDAIGAALEYNTDLFDAATIARMAEHYCRLLDAALTTPDVPITRLPLLGPAEQRQLLVEWNQTDAPLPLDRCVHDLFAEQARRTPSATAASCAGQTLTYAELDARANRLAHLLQRRGVGPDARVAIALPRSLDLLVALLAVLKAGGAYLPLDLSYPAERLAFMLADATPVAVLTRRATAAEHATVLATVPQILLDEAALDQQPATLPSHGATPEHLAYLIYTSGSTGRPKGAMITHRGLVNYLAWAVAAYGLAEGGGALVHSSIAFDLTVTGLFGPLLAGTPVHLLPEPSDPSDLARALDDHDDLSLVKITPAHLDLLAEQLGPARLAGRTRAFIIGGESLRADSLRIWRTHAPDTALVNEYGPTETVVGCCIFTVPADGDPPEGTVPIGRPIANTRLYVLDRALQPVPTGVVGELYIGGAGVARGYLNRADLTAERFVPDPFAAGGRLYRSGDLARWRADGVLECLGRTDDQVKIRGYRIELGEIEAVLSEHPSVGAAAVTVRAGQAGARRLIGYVTPLDGPVDLREVRAWLSARLPEYMVPAALVELPALPLTVNGKVDRKALPDAPASREPTEPHAPRGEVEALLAEIWAHVLGLPSVGVHDDFFEIGGDSILAIQLVARANQAGLQLTPRQLFQASTIAQLAPLAGSGPRVDAEQGPVVGPLPLTAVQRWFFALGLANPHHWNQALLFEAGSPPDRAALERALQALLAHHDALRLRFRAGPGGWEQWSAAPGGAPPLDWVDLAGTPDDRLPAAISVAAAGLQAGLQIEHGPLIRVGYLDLGPRRSGRLLIAIHHLAVDAVSWGVLLEDFQAAYGQALADREIRLPRKSTSFRAWAVRLAAHAEAETTRAQLGYWRSVVQPPLTPLPIDGSGPNHEADARSVTVTLGHEETEALLRAATVAYQATIGDLLLAALTHALCGWAGGPLLLDLEGHGRANLFDDVDLSRTVGWFTAIYPVRLEGAGAALPELVRQIAERQRQVPEDGIGYGLLRFVAGEPSLTAAPRAGVSFNYLGQIDQGHALSGEAALTPAADDRGADRDPGGARSYLLEIDGSLAGGRLQFGWTYAEGVHRRETIAGVAEMFVAALRELAAAAAREASAVDQARADEFGWDAADLADIMAEIRRHGAE